MFILIQYIYQGVGGFMMNLIVVYSGIGKIAADQLKKLVIQGNSYVENSIGAEEGHINVIAMEEEAYLDNTKVGLYNDPVLFIDDVKCGKEIKPIAKPKKYGYGVICGFAGPQAVLTVNAKSIRKTEDYNKFVDELNTLTFQQISKVPKGFHAIVDTLGHGLIGFQKRRKNEKKQQLIYGVTKFYNEDIRDFMKLCEKNYD